MKSSDIENIYHQTKQRYDRAKQTLALVHKRAFNEDSAISDSVPGYMSRRLEFGSFDEDKFAVLFIDMRNSTNRAISIGAEKTFLTMHAYIPAMIAAVEFHNGYVLDLTGDGLMVFFGGKNADPKLNKERTIQKAGLCGRDMLIVMDKVVNKILRDDDITWSVDCGVGIDFGEVIVTKIGTEMTYDVKAFGDCINWAAKHSDKFNKVCVSKYVRNHWPSGEDGYIHFKGNDTDGYILSDRRGS